jgi:hypothetical protein
MIVLQSRVRLRNELGIAIFGNCHIILGRADFALEDLATSPSGYPLEPIF